MSKVQEILQFLSQLREHNDREWFHENKGWYDSVRNDFEHLIGELLSQLQLFDDEMKHVSPKECIFRIYRDVRFSLDKSPYKTHFGAYMAAGGGRKSVRGGYYLHLEPDASFASVGVWCPEPDLLKRLRQSVYDNVDELDEICHEPDFARYYTRFYEEGMLKKVPREFPKDAPHADWLKLKHYLMEYRLPDVMLDSDRFVDEVTQVFKAGQPLNRFLNYTVDEYIE